MIRQTICSIAIALALVTSSGCGGGGSDSSSESSGIAVSSLSKAQFTKRADAICTRDDLLGPISAYMTRREHSGQPGAVLAADAVRKTTVPLLRQQIADIRSLGAPAGGQKQLEAFLSAFQQNVDSLEERQQLTLNPGLENVLLPSRKLALAYGLESCF